jgi:hypothetical protein
MVMRDAGVPPGRFTFVDLGCGKGAVLLLALDAGFASVVGVERNDRLVPIARGNVETYRTRKGIDRPAEVIQDDVVHYALPHVPTVLYLYNPFGPDTLTAVLGNLEESLRQHPRDVVVAYFSPAHRELLDVRPWLDRVPVRSRKWAIYRTVGTGGGSTDAGDESVPARDQQRQTGAGNGARAGGIREV